MSGAHLANTNEAEYYKGNNKTPLEFQNLMKRLRKSLQIETKMLSFLKKKRIVA